MSRNLCRIACYYCGDTPRLIEPPRPLTEADAHKYFGEFKGMLVAHAICDTCDAKYIAWADERTRTGSYDGRGITHPRQSPGDGTHFDLSFRSSFNDEPGDEDLPRANVIAALKRAREAGRLEGIDESAEVLRQWYEKERG